MDRWMARQRKRRLTKTVAVRFPSFPYTSRLNYDCINRHF